MIHCCEAPRSMLSNYFSKKHVRRATFGEIWRIQIQMYPKNICGAKIWCMLLEKQSQCPYIRVSGPTEPKSSSPYGNSNMRILCCFALHWR